MRRIHDKDISNRRYGKLLVLSEVGINENKIAMWLCKCDCGNIKKVSFYNLISGYTKSCGCLEKEVNKRKDRIGERHGKLVIIELTKDRKIVKVRCDCGVEKLVRLPNLRSTKSCGCWKKNGGWHVQPKNTKPFGEAAKGNLYKSYKRDAENRGYSFNISIKEFSEITKENCFYCGIEPMQKQRGYHGNYIYNGIDRMDNKLGYEKYNVVPCCKKCNRAKDIMSKKDFEKWINMVYHNLQEKRILKIA